MFLVKKNSSIQCLVVSSLSRRWSRGLSTEANTVERDQLESDDKKLKQQKYQELGKLRSRPLYLDAQATTPMVNPLELKSNLHWLFRTHVFSIKCCRTWLISTGILIREHTHSVGKVRKPWKMHERYDASASNSILTSNERFRKWPSWSMRIRKRLSSLVEQRNRTILPSKVSVVSTRKRRNMPWQHKRFVVLSRFRVSSWSDEDLF